MSYLWVLGILLAIGVLLYNRASIIVTAIAGVVGLTLVSVFSPFSVITNTILWVLFLAIVTPLLITPVRRKYLSSKLLAYFRHVMPKMSATEKQAIAAGTVVWEGEVFSGAPNWKNLLQKSGTKLSKEEQAFIDGPVEELCRMLDDWDITNNRANIPPEVWQFMKDKGFFGMIIPKRYGGLEFSASAHAAVIVKIASCSISVASSIAVPNSLGPAELLLHYGTEEQKNYYLPRLASGKEVPCFALTGPEAGSDASAIPDSGVICKGQFEGKEITGIRLNFNKRYITLAPIANVVGLAFKLYDPDHLIGEKKDIGITCALIPRNTPGISIGRRHYPLNIAFLNGPIHGKDVFIPLDWIIGGVAQAGHGWTMLVECLSVGRGITLPSISAASVKVGTFTTGAYARIRKQFGTFIGSFEGIQEPLARIVGNAYMVEALSKFTLAAIDRGEKPAVLTAISKYHTTTLARTAMIDAMDIHGGKGICLGPKNYLGRAYQGTPISITVEGANILTRSMIIFGQGAIRCHPYVLAELNAATDKDERQGLINFDKAIFAHIGFITSNMLRSLVLGVTGARIVMAPSGVAKHYYQDFTRFSTILALLTDMSMGLLGGDLKRKESISARLGDILSMLCIGSAVLKYFDEQGQPKEYVPVINWVCQVLLVNMQDSVDSVLRNFPNRLVAGLLRVLIFPFGRRFEMPRDKLNQQLADLVMNPSEARNRLAQGIFLGAGGSVQYNKMEAILAECVAAEPIEKAIERAKRKHEIDGKNFEELIDAAVAAKVITEDEGKQMHAAHHARLEVIGVDDFDTNELGTHPSTLPVEEGAEEKQYKAPEAKKEEVKVS